MAITFEEAREILQKHAAEFDDKTFSDQCLNHAKREVAQARRWPELMVRDFFNTVAAYETGTIAVTKDTTTVTLTGGVLPSDLATGLYRFAISKSDPWYEVATRTNDTSMELADNYVQATQTASDFIVYKSHYSMPAAVDRIEQVWIHDAGRAIKLIEALTDDILTEFLHYPSGPGVPTHFYSMERDSSDNRQILLGPQTPDDVYRVEYVYKAKSTDNQFSDFDVERWPVIMARALSLAYAPEFYERSLAEHRKYEVLLEREWQRTNETESDGLVVGDARMRYPGNYDYLEHLLGYGRVQDPS